MRSRSHRLPGRVAVWLPFVVQEVGLIEVCLPHRSQVSRPLRALCLLGQLSPSRRALSAPDVLGLALGEQAALAGPPIGAHVDQPAAVAALPPTLRWRALRLATVRAGGACRAHGGIPYTGAPASAFIAVFGRQQRAAARRGRDRPGAPVPREVGGPPPVENPRRRSVAPAGGSSRYARGRRGLAHRDLLRAG